MANQTYIDILDDIKGETALSFYFDNLLDISNTEMILSLERYVSSFLGVPAQYCDDIFEDVGIMICCERVGEDTRVIKEAYIYPSFVHSSDKLKEIIMQHEKGHIMAFALRWPHHQFIASMDDKQWTEIGDNVYSKLYFCREAEADFYAAVQMGLDNTIEFLDSFISNWKDKQRRITNLICLDYLEDGLGIRRNNEGTLDLSIMPKPIDKT